MLKTLIRKYCPDYSDLTHSKLHNEDTFYPELLRDLKKCKSEVLIESAFITCRRLNQLLPTLEKLKARKVRIIVNTRDPRNGDSGYCRNDALEAISKLQHLGVQVVYTGNHHRKLVVIDRKVLYEGSLNILSQNNSCEIMRRIESQQIACEMIRFVRLDNYVV